MTLALRGRHLLMVASVVFACAGAAGAALPKISANEPGIPAGYKLLEKATVPATTPFNSGVQLKTTFGIGQTYYMVASGTASLGNGAVSVDPIYCFDANPPSGGCPPAVPPTYWGGINLLWYFGNAFTNYNTSGQYGLAGPGWLPYQPSHRYVYKFTTPANTPYSRLSLGGPNSSDPSTARGGFTIAVYGKELSHRVQFSVFATVRGVPLVLHIPDPVPKHFKGDVHVNGGGIVLADGKPGQFGAWVHDSDVAQPNTYYYNAVGLHVIAAELDVTPTTRTLTLHAYVGSYSHVGPGETCRGGPYGPTKAGTADIVLVDDATTKIGTESDPLDAVHVHWTGGTCLTHEHTITRHSHGLERLRVEIACWTPSRGYRFDACG
jgi:hypothetical protein